MIPQIKKFDPAVIADILNPSCNADLLPDFLFAHFAAKMRSVLID